MIKQQLRIHAKSLSDALAPYKKKLPAAQVWIQNKRNYMSGSDSITPDMQFQFFWNPTMSNSHQTRHARLFC